VQPLLLSCIHNRHVSDGWLRPHEMGPYEFELSFAKSVVERVMPNEARIAVEVALAIAEIVAQNETQVFRLSGLP
jgi:hypothetical protein